MTSGTQPVWNKEVTSGDLRAIFDQGNHSLGINAVEKLDNSLENPLKGSSNENQALSQFSDITQKFIDYKGHLEMHIDKLSSELAAQTAEKEQQFEERNR